MHFTREPIVESVITPREGYKLVIRNSKGIGQEEFLVDVVEVVTFGMALFFRSSEKPKTFLLPVADYELLEVRETRVVLRHSAAPKGTRRRPEPEEPVVEERKKERRRRRQPREEESVDFEPPYQEEAPLQEREVPTPADFSALSTILPPPSELISDHIDRYKEIMESCASEELEEEYEDREFEEDEAEEFEGPQEMIKPPPFSPSQFLRRFRRKDEEGEEGEELQGDDELQEGEEEPPESADHLHEEGVEEPQPEDLPKD